MNDFEAKAVALLTSIDASMKKLVAAANRRAAAGRAPDVSGDADLDSPHGDEVVKFLPRDWTGPQGFKGKRMSECPPELLDVLASSYDYFASKNDEKGEEKKAGYDRRAAARARGWSRRLRGGWKPQASSASGSSSSFDDADGLGSGKGDAFEGGDNFGGAEDF